MDLPHTNKAKPCQQLSFWKKTLATPKIDNRILVTERHHFDFYPEQVQLTLAGMSGKFTWHSHTVAALFYFYHHWAIHSPPLTFVSLHFRDSGGKKSLYCHFRLDRCCCLQRNISEHCRKVFESQNSHRSVGMWQVLLSHRYALSLSVCENVLESVSEAGR